MTGRQQPGVDDVARAFRAVGTSVLGDALDVVGVDGGVRGLRRVSGDGVIAGPAFTVRFTPVEPGSPAPAADYIDDVPAGAVIVIDNGGIDHCTVWGDILTLVARRRSVAGTVIDGCCRDVDDLVEARYPVWARATHCKSGKNRVALERTAVPVHVGGVLVRPGDFVCADGSGVLVVPAESTAIVVDTAERIVAVERRIREDVTASVPLREARARHGYHSIALRRAGR